jgi:BirA family transcriptional regulator, biotin operon repressor / biotin---[acetyl-CoA-carboxylase] ligase
MNAPNSPFPWLHWLETCPSTNRWALDHLADLNHGDVIFTQQQTAGRGQQGRVWHSPPGVLTASVVLRGLAVNQLPGFSLIVGLAVIEAVEALCPALSQQLQLKWPNDVMLHRQKLAGILCESVVRRDAAVVVGIGLNWQVDWAGAAVNLERRATSLHQWTPAVPTEMQLLEQLRQGLLNRLEALNSPSSAGLVSQLPAIRQRDFLRGRVITVESAGGQFAGEAGGLSDRGHLLLQLPNGQVRPFMSGHVIW